MAERKGTGKGKCRHSASRFLLKGEYMEPKGSQACQTGTYISMEETSEPEVEQDGNPGISKRSLQTIGGPSVPLRLRRSWTKTGSPPFRRRSDEGESPIKGTAQHQVHQGAVTPLLVPHVGSGATADARAPLRVAQGVVAPTRGRVWWHGPHRIAELPEFLNELAGLATPEAAEDMMIVGDFGRGGGSGVGWRVGARSGKLRRIARQSVNQAISGNFDHT